MSETNAYFRDFVDVTGDKLARKTDNTNNLSAKRAIPYACSKFEIFLWWKEKEFHLH